MTHSYAYPAYRKTEPEIVTFYKPYMAKTYTGHCILSEHPFSYHFNRNVIFNAPETIQDSFFIHILSHQNSYLWIEAPKEMIAMILHPFITPLSLQDLHPKMIVNALEIVCASHIEILEKEYGMSISFDPIENTEDINAVHKTQYIFSHEQNNTQYPVNIWGSADNIHDILDKLFAFAQPTPSLRCHIQCQIIAAIKQFPQKKINQLQRGEIIIMIGERHILQQPLLIIEDKLVVYGQVDNNKITLTSSAHLKENIQEITMNEGDTPDLDPIPEEEKTAAMADMRVPVSFELGRLDLPIATLSKLQQGEIIELQKPITENITIIANGKTVALGEVIQIGQNFGVLIKDIIE